MKGLIAVAGIIVFFVSCNDIPAQIVTKDITDYNREAFSHVVLLDVRTPEEYNRGHLHNAININILDETFTQTVNKLDKKKPVYVYCQVGGRSTRASEKLKALGFVNIVNLMGGYSAWQKAGKPVVN